MKLDKSVKAKGKTLRQIKENLERIDGLLANMNNQYSGRFSFLEGWDFCWCRRSRGEITFEIISSDDFMPTSDRSGPQSLNDYPALGSLWFRVWDMEDGTSLRTSSPCRMKLVWRDSGKIHREDAPAIIEAEKKANGTWILEREEYYCRGKLHNLQGPARRYSDAGTLRYLWYFYGNELTKGQVSKLVNNPLNISKRQQAYLKLLYYPSDQR